jgi:hypothetical protein
MSLSYFYWPALNNFVPNVARESKRVAHPCSRYTNVSKPFIIRGTLHLIFHNLAPLTAIYLYLNTAQVQKLVVPLEQGSQTHSYAGHILTKKGLAGCIKRKNVSAGHNRRLKLHLYYKKQ